MLSHPLAQLFRHLQLKNTWNQTPNKLQPMSLDKITSTTDAPIAKRQRSLAWLLPIGLLLGFIVILISLFGDRLLPAVEVKTARVVTLRKADGTAPTQSPDTTGNGKGQLLKGQLKFQASGWIEPDPYVTYVPALINGVVKSVYVLEGQMVKQGDLLTTLIDDDAKLDLIEAQQNITSLKATIIAHCKGIDISNAELEAAKNKVVTAKAHLSDALDNLRRLKRIEDGAIPKQQLMQAALKVEQQQAVLAESETEIPRIQARLEQINEERLAMDSKVDQLETVRARAQLALDRTKITSPVDGMILHLHAAPGKKRMLDMDDPKSAVIVELYDPEKLQARVDVPLNEAAGLMVGQHVELLTDLLPETIFKGKVTRITGEADLQRNTLQAKIEITNPDPRLRPEMLVRAKFFGSDDAAGSASNPSANSQRLSIYVPESAVASSNLVWVVSPDNRAISRTVKLGTEVRDGHRLVISGLKSGEQVILPPHDQLDDGARVNPQPEN